MLDADSERQRAEISGRTESHLRHCRAPLSSRVHRGMVRFKNRYLLAEFDWHDGRVDDSMTETALVGIIRKEMALNFGDVGAGAALGSTTVKYWNPTAGLAVVRCGRDVYRNVWASMTLLREVKGRYVAVRVRHCASTLRSSQRAAIERTEHRYARVARHMPGGERYAAKGAADASRAIRALQP